jgi:hypothetical protein
MVLTIKRQKEKPTFAEATVNAVEPTRIKSNSFLKGMKQIEAFLQKA